MVASKYPSHKVSNYMSVFIFPTVIIHMQVDKRFSKGVHVLKK